MSDSSRPPRSDADPSDALGVAGYLLDETLPDVTASRIAADLGAAMTSKSSRTRRARVAGALVVTAAAAAVVVALLPQSPRQESAPASAPVVKDAPAATAPERSMPQAPSPAPYWPRPTVQRQPSHAEAKPSSPASISRSAPASAPEERRLTTDTGDTGEAASAPPAPTIVTGAVVPAEVTQDKQEEERVIHLFAMRTDRPRMRPMMMRISYRPSTEGGVREGPR